MIKYYPLTISSVVHETPSTVTLSFDKRLDVRPGQFIMVSDFERGEKPFSVSHSDPAGFSITVKALGPFSKRLTQMQAGERLSVRGPYGSAFTIPAAGSKLAIVGGGCGAAPLMFLLTELLKRGLTRVIFINGAKTQTELVFAKELEDVPVRIINTTDDGSLGPAQSSVDALAKLLASESFDMIYTAGPELMMKGVFDLTRELPVRAEFLLERYMKCAVGVCGQCTLDPSGIRLCVEGPVVGKDVIASSTEFGVYTRDVFGARRRFAGAEAC